MCLIRTKVLQGFQRLKLVLMRSRVLNYSHGTRLVFSLLTNRLTTVSTANGYGVIWPQVDSGQGQGDFFDKNISTSSLYAMRPEVYLSGGDVAEAWSCIFTPHMSLVLKNWDNQITAGFSDLLEAAQNNTHAYVHYTEKSTKLTHTLELTDTKDFVRGVLKFNTLSFRNRIGPCLVVCVFQNKSYCIIIFYTVIKHGLESN